MRQPQTRKPLARLFKSPREDNTPEWYAEGGASSLRAEPRVELWRAVLRLAWMDLFGTVACEDCFKGVLEAKYEAAHFLIADESTEWGASRRDICNLLGMNPDELRLETILTIQTFESIAYNVGRLAREVKRMQRREAQNARNRRWKAKREAQQSPQRIPDAAE